MTTMMLMGTTSYFDGCPRHRYNQGLLQICCKYCYCCMRAIVCTASTVSAAIVADIATTIAARATLAVLHDEWCR